MRALVAPASLKGVLTAGDAVAALLSGFAAANVEAVGIPVADGGEGTLDALDAALGGEWQTAEVHDAFGSVRCARWLALPDGTAALEAAEAIPLDPAQLDPIRASSRGLGELVLAVGKPRSLLIGLGGTATVDGGAGLREVVSELPAPTRVACDVSSPLVDAARVFARQKGATEAQAGELERRLARMPELERYAAVPGAGAAGGLGAALAALGGELVPGSGLVLDEIGLDPAGFALVVTGEGTVDATTAAGKAPSEVARRAREAGVRCVVFGGRVVQPLPGAETVSLSGDPSRAVADLVSLGELLGRQLV